MNAAKDIGGDEKVPFSDMDRRVIKPVRILFKIALVCGAIGHMIGAEETVVFFLFLLAVGAWSGVAAYCQIRRGEVLVGQSTWAMRGKWADKTDRPIAYWFTTTMHILCVIAVIVCTIIFLILGSEEYNPYEAMKSLKVGS